MANRLTSLDFSTPAIELKAGQFTGRWQELMRLLFGDVASFTSQAAIIDSKSIAQLNVLGLGAGDDGYLARVTDGFNHVVRWDGSAWQWGPGDAGNGYKYEFFASTPSSDMWALCDGSGTTYLTGIGTGTLAASAFTTPTITAGTFGKSGTYTGSVVAAVAPAVAMSGSTATEQGHFHSVNIANQQLSFNGATVDNNGGGSTVSVVASSPVPDTDITGQVTGQADPHLHGVGTLAATADTAARPPSLAAPWYFRR